MHSSIVVTFLGQVLIAIPLDKRVRGDAASRRAVLFCAVGYYIVWAYLGRRFHRYASASALELDATQH